MADASKPAGAAAPTPPTTISLRVPSKYAASAAATTASSPSSPPLDWLCRTWSVTHSTLAMWTKARNVRITYAPLPPRHATTARLRIADTVEHEALSGRGTVSRIVGVDTASATDATHAWDWRGKGWLLWVTSHWEVLGWGEQPLAGSSDGAGGGVDVERWMVTWFAPTPFTKEGVDVYCDRREGPSEATAQHIMAALQGLKDAQPVADMVARDMKPVAIVLPWKDK